MVRTEAHISYKIRDVRPGSGDKRSLDGCILYGHRCFNCYHGMKFWHTISSSSTTPGIVNRSRSGKYVPGGDVAAVIRACRVRSDGIHASRRRSASLGWAVLEALVNASSLRADSTVSPVCMTKSHDHGKRTWKNGHSKYQYLKL